MTDKDELAALKARVEELERANAPAPPPPDWTPPPNPIDRLAMPQSVAREMAKAVPSAMVRDVMRDHRSGPTGPSSAGAIPSSQMVSNVRGAGVPGMGTGWRPETPLSNPPGVNWVDAIAIADDVLGNQPDLEKASRSFSSLPPINLRKRFEGF
jgi:hypothetical protein